MARCPNCKEPVSQFAAGCAVCGADLEAARRERAGRRRPSLPQVPAVPQDVFVALVMLLLVAFVPLVGVLMTLYVISRERATSQRPLRIALWLAVAGGLALLALPETRSVGLLAYL
jgi:hypothetical protein